MSWGAAMLAALLIVLPRPGTWVVALAAFLVRGGLLLFLVPIVVLPSPVGLANLLGPSITAFWLGGLSLGLAAIVAAIFGAFLAWLLIGGWAAAVTERDLIELVAADDEVAGMAPTRTGSETRQRGRIWRIVLVRLACHIPLAVALGYGAVRLVEATYRELTLPGDVTTPIAWRVIAAVPEAVVGIAVAWSFGEALGSLAARRLVLWRQSVDAAYVGAWADLLRRPLSTAATFAAPAVVLALVVGPVVLAAGIIWEALRAELAGPTAEDVPIVVATILAFIAIWSAGLLVAGLLAAWRSAAWTVEGLRTRGTFGVVAGSRPGSFNGPEASGSV